MKALFAALCLARIGLAAANFACVCNYKQTVTVYSKETTLSAPLGNIGGWGCNQILSMSVADQWYPVAFQHQVGYVKEDPHVQMQMCVGDPPTEHNITPAPAITTFPKTTPTTKSTTTTTTTTATPTTTTPPPTTTTTTNPPTTTGDVNACPLPLRLETTQLHDALGHFGTKCYALDPRLKLAWGSAEGTCAKYGAHLVHITSAAEQAFVHKFVATHAPGQAMWIGLNDVKREGAYSWSNGGGLHYNHWVPHHTYHAQRTDDCVAMRTDGYWDDIGCGFHLLGRDHGTHIFACEFDYGKTQSILG